MRNLWRTAAAAGAIVVLAACTSSTATTTTTEAPTTTTQPPTTTLPQPGEVEVTLVDYAILGLPGSVPAGTRLSITNDSDAELHEIVVFRLPDGETRTAAELSQLSPDDLEHAFGGPPVAVLLAPPGGPQIPAVGDGVLHDPGDYVIFCFIPTGVDPQVYLDAAAASEGGPPVIEGAGPPHFVHGMFADLRVDAG